LSRYVETTDYIELIISHDKENDRFK